MVPDDERKMVNLGVSKFERYIIIRIWYVERAISILNESLPYCTLLKMYVCTCNEGGCKDVCLFK